MDTPLTTWLTKKDLVSLGTQLTDRCGIKNVEELQLLAEDPTTLEEVIQLCQMNPGEKLRFRKAFKEDPNPALQIQRLENTLRKTGRTVPSRNGRDEATS